jgi:hypothetical protein
LVYRNPASKGERPTRLMPTGSNLGNYASETPILQRVTETSPRADVTTPAEFSVSLRADLELKIVLRGWPDVPDDVRTLIANMIQQYSRG